MKPGPKKIIIAIILAIVLVIAFGWIIMMLNHAILIRNHEGDEKLKLEEFTNTLDEIEANWKSIEKRMKVRYMADTTLSALALRNIIQEKGDEAIAPYSNGAVIKIENGQITAPDGIDKKLGLTADLFETGQGMLYSGQGLFVSPEDPNLLVSYGRINQPYYYVEWYADTDLSRQVEEVVDIPGILRRAEAAYDLYALCVSEDPDENGESRIIYSNEKCTDLVETLQATDPSAVSIEKTVESSTESSTESSGEKTEGSLSKTSDAFESGTITLTTGTFRYIKADVPRINGYLALMSVQPNLYIKALSRASWMNATLILILAALLTAGFSVYYFIRRNNLSPAMEKNYAPGRVRRFASLWGVVGAIMILLIGMLIYALNVLYDDTAKGKERLQMVEESLRVYPERYKINAERFKDIYLEYGTHIAELLDNYPELRDKFVLETLADTISVTSISLYDKNGNETISSGDYIGLSLGTDPESATYDFRRILNGTPSIAHDAKIDERTGLDQIMIGMRIKDDTDPDRYGVMMICVDPTSWNFSVTGMSNTILKDLSGPGVLLCIADSQTGKIISSGDENLVGRDISVLGLKETDLKGSLIKNVDTEEGPRFVTSSELPNEGILEGSGATGDLIAIYEAAQGTSLIGLGSSSLTGCLLFLLIYGLLAWFILNGYTDEYFEQNKGIECSTEANTKGWVGFRRFISSIRPERIGLVTIEVILALYLVQQIPISNFKTGLSRNSVYYYLTSGQWEKGFNLFALAGIVVLFGQTVLTVIVIRVLLTICSTFVGVKGKTICRLIRSLTMYIALFVFLIMACIYIGISPAVILGALGTLGIAVSLGAQHFVSDIIAGLTIVFEGTFHVGDIVDLHAGTAGTYHGEIREIGLRFVKIQTRDGNIVTLSNREINMVNNMTQLNSRYVCELTISSAYSIEEIEALLKEELPKIGQKDRRILAGPFYNGILKLGDGTMTLSITTECSEEDLPDVQVIINRALQQIFLEAGYTI